MADKLKATRTKGKLKPTSSSAAATKAQTGFEHKHLKAPKSTIELKQEPLGDVGTPFKLRGGTGKIDSYGAFQRQGLISPMQVEDPPKKKGRTIMDMSNAEIYRLQKEGKFGGEGNKSMKLLLNSPKGKDYSTFKSYRDKEIANRSKVVTDQSVEKRKETDQQKSYGTDDWKKKQTQKAGKVFDAKGSQLYPGQEGHSEARVKAAKEGYSKDVEVKRL